MELLEPVIHAAIYLLTFLLLLLLLWLMGKILRIVEKLPVIHSCNQFGGALLGLLCGAIVVSVLLWAGGVFGWLTPDTVQQGYFAKYFLISFWQ